MAALREGDRVVFRPNRGKVREGTVYWESALAGMIWVKLDGDPFEVEVRLDQCRTCGTSEEGVPSASESGIAGSKRKRRYKKMANASDKTPAQRRKEIKELATKAQKLGVEDAQDMSRQQLVDAIAAAEALPATVPKPTRAPAKKVPPKKAAAKRAPAKKAAPAKAKVAPKKAIAAAESADPTGNPFRKGTDRHLIFGLLLKGGTRRKIAEAVQKKVTLRPYSDDHGDPTIFDYDKRVTLTAQVLRDTHAFEYVKDGRGLEQVIRVVPPSANGQASRKAPAKAAKKAPRKAVAK